MRQAYDYWQDQPGSIPTGRRSPACVPTPHGVGPTQGASVIRSSKGQRQHVRGAPRPYHAAECTASERPSADNAGRHDAPRRQGRTRARAVGFVVHPRAGDDRKGLTGHDASIALGNDARTDRLRPLQRRTSFGAHRRGGAGADSSMPEQRPCQPKLPNHRSRAVRMRSRASLGRPASSTVHQSKWSRDVAVRDDENT